MDWAKALHTGIGGYPRFRGTLCVQKVHKIENHELLRANDASRGVHMNPADFRAIDIRVGHVDD
jgi:hypothetical protein